MTESGRKIGRRCRESSVMVSHLSAYEVKNDCWSFESLFKVKKNEVFLFGISTFLYYSNEESDDVIGGSQSRI